MSGEEELFNGLDDGLDVYVEDEGSAEGLIDPSTAEDGNADDNAGNDPANEDAPKPGEDSKKNKNIPPLDDGLKDLIEIEDDDIAGDGNNEEDEGGTQQPEQSSSPSNLDNYLTFAENLKTAGFLPSFEKETFEKMVKEEDKTPEEALIELQRKDYEEAENSFKENLSDEDRAIYEGKKSGVPLDMLGQLDNAIKEYQSLTEDYFSSEKGSKIAKQLLINDLKNKGNDEDIINTTIDKWEEEDVLVDKALKVKDNNLESFKNKRQELFDNKEKEKQKNKEKIDNEKKELKSFIDNTNELLPGVELDAKMKDQLYKDFTQPAEYDDDGKPVDVISSIRNKNSKAFDTALRYYNRIGLFNFDSEGKFSPDFSEIRKALNTKKAKKYKSIFDNNDAFGSRNNNLAPKNTEDDGLFDNL